MPHISAKKVAKYLFLPGILPRARDMGNSGFGYLAFLIACVYNAVRILPPTHPYVNPANIGSFTIRQAVAAAANHVKLDRKNIDQVIVFFVVLAAIILLALQFFAFIYLVLSGQAWAADPAAGGGFQFEGIFKTVKPDNDIALMILDNVFGIPDFFGSKAATGTPFHQALQALFKFYNLAILIVAVLVFLYYVVVVVAETAQTGVPFGKRFSHIYAPFRLVAALGLLVPINYGLNASQYITLAAARMGSGFATNGWIKFNDAVQENPLGVDKASLIAKPNAPDMTSLAAFMTVVHSCKAAYEKKEKQDNTLIKIDAYLTDSKLDWPMSGISYEQALQWSEGGNIIIAFGWKESAESAGDSKPKFIPYCGKLAINIDAQGKPTQGADGSWTTGSDSSGSGLSESMHYMQKAYYNLVKLMWEGKGEYENLKKMGEQFAGEFDYNNKTQTSCTHPDLEKDCKTAYKPDSAFKGKVVQALNEAVRTQLEEAVKKARSSINTEIGQEVLDRGWGGAGIWYNKIAQINGAVIGNTYKSPAPTTLPMTMQYILQQKKGSSGVQKSCETFALIKADKQPITFPKGASDKYYGQVMDAAYSYWMCDQTSESKAAPKGNMFWDAMNIFFGTSGLFNIRENMKKGKDAVEVHPLAQLTAIGKGLVDSAVRNMTYSLFFAGVGGFASAMESQWGPAAQAVSGFFVSIATIGLAVGFVLYYILPFLPFIYFFFAVGSWVKTIFEAMVGAPLWALAHLRIDGDGFPGKSAMNGYFLIFEIFIRPILTVFGLIGGLAIFAAMANMLNEVFSLVVLNVTGTDLSANPATGGTTAPTNGLEQFRRSVIDEFFFTIVYAVILYMMGIASFKMIDQVPNHILRWIGAGVPSFSDQAGDPVGSLTQYAAVGGAAVGGQIAGSLNNLGRATGAMAGAVARSATKK